MTRPKFTLDEFRARDPRIFEECESGGVDIVDEKGNHRFRFSIPSGTVPWLDDCECAMTEQRKQELLAAIERIFGDKEVAGTLRRINTNSGILFRAGEETLNISGFSVKYSRTTIDDSDFLPILFLANVGLEALGGLEDHDHEAFNRRKKRNEERREEWKAERLKG